MKFKICHCEFTIRISFLLMISLLLMLDTTGFLSYGLLAAAIHELSHVFMMILCGRIPKKICLTAFGAEISASSEKTSYQKDCLVNLSGPAVNLLLGGLLVLLGNQTLFAQMNLALGLFNLLPIIPLDGGQALFSLLCLYFPENTVEKILKIISFCILVPLGILGFIILFHSKWNFSLLLCSVYLMAFLLLK